MKYQILFSGRKNKTNINESADRVEKVKAKCEYLSMGQTCHSLSLVYDYEIMTHKS